MGPEINLQTNKVFVFPNSVQCQFERIKYTTSLIRHDSSNNICLNWKSILFDSHQLQNTKMSVSDTLFFMRTSDGKSAKIRAHLRLRIRHKIRKSANSRLCDIVCNLNKIRENFTRTICRTHYFEVPFFCISNIDARIFLIDTAEI